MMNPKQTSRKIRRVCHKLMKTEQIYKPDLQTTPETSPMIYLQDTEVKHLFRIEQTFQSNYELNAHLELEGMWENEEYQQAQLQNNIKEWLEADPREIERLIIELRDNSLEAECYEVKNSFYQWLGTNEKYPSKPFMVTIRKLGDSFTNFYCDFKSQLKSRLNFECEHYDQLKEQKNAEKFKSYLFEVCNQLKDFLENFNIKYLDSNEELELKKQKKKNAFINILLDHLAKRKKKRRKNRDRKKKKNKQWKENSISTADPDLLIDLTSQAKLIEEKEQISIIQSVIKNLFLMEIEKEKRVQCVVSVQWIDKLRQKVSKN